MNIANQLVLFWQGKITLWKSYWLIGELINAIVILIILNIELKLFNNVQLFEIIPSLKFNEFHFINKFIVFVWTIFITVGIWRSAEKYQGRLIWTILTLIVLSYRLFIIKEIFH